MNMQTTMPPVRTPAAIWADATSDTDAIVRNPKRLVRLAELLSQVEREAIEGAVELLIAFLDAGDGDADLEDDDPSGDPLDRGEAPTETGARLLKTKPQYGVDQRRGPTNEREAHRAYCLAQIA